MEQREVLKLMALAQLMLESMDDFKETSMYKQQTKQTVQRLEALLKSQFGRSIDMMYQAEPEHANMLLTGVEETIDLLATLNIDNITLLGNTIKALKEEQENGK